MKKILASILTLVFVVAFFGCSRTQNVSGSCKIVIMSETATEYTVNLSDITISDGVLSILNYLKENENLALEYQTDVYGAYITKVGELTPSGNQYICVYTSVEKDFDVGSYAKSITYEGVNLTSAGVGVLQLTVENNAVYYFDLSSF